MANVKPPSICDFCGDKTPAKRLMGWPCATFEGITARYENAAYMVCACHTRDSLPPKAVIVERRNFIG